MVKIHKTTLDGKIYHMGYRVVTEDLRSLGLRNNPTILTYPIGEWYFLFQDELRYDKKDVGGIWVARTLGGANGVRRYMLKRYLTKTRIFKAALGDILYYNSYRIKTSGINMFEEI